VADLVNLRRARKARERAAKAASADQNRIAHGRSAAEKQVARRETERYERRLDGAKRESD
jgi:hypothetical protein